MRESGTSGRAVRSRDVSHVGAAAVASVGLGFYLAPRGSIVVLGLLAVIGLIFSLVTIRQSRAAVVAATVTLLSQILVPITLVPSWGVVKYAVPLLGFIAPVIVMSRTGLSLRGMVLFAAPLVLYVPVTLSHDDPSAIQVLAAMLMVTVPLAALVSGFDAGQRQSMRKSIVMIAIAETVYAYAEQFELVPKLFRGSFPGQPGIIAKFSNGVLHTADRAQGTLGHPLLLGLLMVLAVTIILTEQVIRNRLLRGFVLAGLMGGMAVAGTRSFLLISVVAMVFLWGYRYRHLTSRLAIGLPFCGLALFIFGLASGFQSWIVTNLLSSESMSHRTDSMATISDLFNHQSLRGLFLGNGFYAQERLYAEGILRDDGIRAVDNQFIYTLATGGLVGLIAVTVLIWVAFRSADRVSRAMLVVTIAAFFVFEIYGWVSSVTMFAVVVGLCLAARDWPETDQAPAGSEP